MNCFYRTLASCVLVAGMVPAQTNDGLPGVRLTPNPVANTLQVQAEFEGLVFLALGDVATPPIRFGNIEFDVQPQYVVPLGLFAAGGVQVLPVMRYMRDLHVEAILVDGDLRLHDSNPVALMDAFVDLIDATFRAELLTTIPPYYTLAAQFTAPTTGHEFRVDALQTDGKEVDVYLRAIEPAVGEMTIPLLEEHRQQVALGTDPGALVRVHLMRQQRGAIGPDVYRLMVTIPVK